MLHWAMSTSFHHHHYAHQYTQHPHAHHHSVSYALVPSSALLFVLPAACLSGCLAAMTGKRKQQDSGKWWNQGLKTFKIVNFVTKKCKQIQFQNIILSKIMNSFYIIVTLWQKIQTNIDPKNHFHEHKTLYHNCKNLWQENQNKNWSKLSYSRSLAFHIMWTLGQKSKQMLI